MHQRNSMNRILFGILCLLCFNVTFAQTLRTHTVESQDTLDSIARLYGVTPNDILALNPDVENQLSVDVVLVIPNAVQNNNLRTTEVQEVISYKIHRVKRKETLFSIAKKYDVSVEEIKQHNQRLLESPLQIKDKLYIPKYKTKTIAVTPQALKIHTVLPKEGKWRVAYKYGISVLELEALNPGLGPVLKPGQKLNVPNIQFTAEQDITDERFDYYKVLPKEGFYRLSKKLGVTKDSLEQLNPGLAETGLKEGMVLKVPKESINNIDVTAMETTLLNNQLQYFEPKSIALLLPFKTNSVNFSSSSIAKQQIQRDGYIRIATEFYAGVEMALDSAKRLGISTNLEVFDTQADVKTATQLIQNKDFSSYDLVLGPITVPNSVAVAKALAKTNTVVVSPFVKLNVNSSNLIQTIPDEDWMAEKLLQHAKKDTVPHKTLIISDAKNKFRISKIKSAFPDAEVLNSELDKDGKDQYYVDFETVRNLLAPGRTVVFLETNNESFASNVSSMLNGLNGITLEKDRENNDIEVERELSLMTTNYNKAFMGSNISNFDLSNLNFQFASVHYHRDGLTHFAKAYKQQFGTYPTRYATRGFDITLDLLLRLTAFSSVFDQLTTIQTAQLENKFKYIQVPNGRYINQSAFILKYQDLFLVKVQD